MDGSKKIKMMDRILVLIAIFLFIFIVAMIVIFCVVGSVPDTLITCVFASCTGELSVMGWIKTTKDKLKGELNNEQTEE